MGRHTATRRAAAFLTFALLACSTTPKPIGRPLAQDRIQFPSFSVGGMGAGWGVERNEQEEFVEFSQSKPVSFWEKGIAGGERIFTLRVFRVPFRPGSLEKKPIPSEQALADEYITTEEENLRVNVLKLLDWEVDVVKKGVKTVGAKAIHFMNYETSGVAPYPVMKKVRGEGMLYVYFPPDFETRGAIYGFLASQVCFYACGAALDADDLSQLDRLVTTIEAR